MKKLISVALLPLLSAAALADSTSQYKMAIIEDSTGSYAIKTGEYRQGVSRITQSVNQQDIYEQVARAMNLCVAYANLKQVQDAHLACDQAIALVKSINNSSGTSKDIASYAFNNRAIFKAKIQDYSGALDDLLMSMEISDNQIAQKNLLKLIKEQSASMQFKS